MQRTLYGLLLVLACSSANAALVAEACIQFRNPVCEKRVEGAGFAFAKEIRPIYGNPLSSFPTSEMRAIARTGFGWMQGESYVYADENYPFVDPQLATTRTQWTDTMTIVSPDALPGTIGTLQIGIRLDIDLIRGGVSGANWLLDVKFGQPAGSVACAVPPDGRPSNRTQTTSFNGTVTCNFLFQYGVPTTLSVDLRTSAMLDGPNSGPRIAEAQFSNTLSWSGISGVLDNSGNRVGSFSAVSESGTDYVGELLPPVPIPPAVWLFGSALGLIGVVRRKISS